MSCSALPDATFRCESRPSGEFCSVHGTKQLEASSRAYMDGSKEEGRRDDIFESYCQTLGNVLPISPLIFGSLDWSSSLFHLKGCLMSLLYNIRVLCLRPRQVSPRFNYQVLLMHWRYLCTTHWQDPSNLKMHFLMGVVIFDSSHVYFNRTPFWC